MGIQLIKGIDLIQRMITLFWVRNVLVFSSCKMHNEVVSDKITLSPRYAFKYSIFVFRWKGISIVSYRQL